MSDNIHVDLTYLRSISLEDDTLVLEMIELFLEKAPKMLDNIETHCQNEEWEKMAAEIHRFKPNLDYMGMGTTKELIEEIESDAKGQVSIESFDDRFAKVKERCLQAYKRLEEERANLK